jgi:hypothetical protein
MSLKKFFALLFIISLAVFLYFQFVSPIINENHPTSTSKSTMQKPGIPSISIETELSADNDFMLLASLITSMLSFLGFLLSSYHSMKGERREEEIFDLKKERERLELDKIRAEIEALRRK